MWKTDPLYELLKDRLYPLKEKLTQKKKLGIKKEYFAKKVENLLLSPNKD